jgi:hypothetical protein
LVKLEFLKFGERVMLWFGFGVFVFAVVGNWGEGEMSCDGFAIRGRVFGNIWEF